MIMIRANKLKAALETTLDWLRECSYIYRYVLINRRVEYVRLKKEIK